MAKLRIVFMGTAEIACPILRALHTAPDFEIAAVATQPDRPKGRHLELQVSPVKQEAQSRGLAVLQPERARNPEFIEALKQLRPDVIVVVAYGQILPQPILDVPRFGCVNVHTSLLPKYRGAAPIQWAILNGESETGVTIMKMEASLDTGPMLSEKRTAIADEDDAQTLQSRLAALGAELIGPTIRDYVAGKIIPRPQLSEGASYARKITKEDGRIDWRQPALALWNRVRAFIPWPGAYTFLRSGGKAPLLKIWKAAVDAPQLGQAGEVVHCGNAGIIVACSEGSLRITELQREGGRRLSAQEFVAGGHIREGEFLNDQPK